MLKIASLRVMGLIGVGPFIDKDCLTWRRPVMFAWAIMGSSGSKLR